MGRLRRLVRLSPPRGQHASTQASRSAARVKGRETPPANALIWIVFNLNPDGFAVGTRQNARGVDLNRNFPYRWQRIGSPGFFNYSGRRPASEPETRIAIRLIMAVRPIISLWFHQHLDLVDASGGNRSIERRFAR